MHNFVVPTFYIYSLFIYFQSAQNIFIFDQNKYYDNKSRRSFQLVSVLKICCLFFFVKYQRNNKLRRHLKVFPKIPNVVVTALPRCDSKSVVGPAAAFVIYFVNFLICNYEEKIQFK